jgi:hypothetical protein
VQGPLGQHRFGVVAHHGLGAPGPVLHRHRGLTHRQRRELGDQCGLVVGEQAGGAVREVGHDGLDLPARQHTVAVGGGGDRQLPEPAGGLGAAGGVASGASGVVAQPGGHGGGAVVTPQFGGVVVADGGEQLGIEPIRQREPFAQHGAVDGQVEAVDRLGETLKSAADLPGHDQ